MRFIATLGLDQNCNDLIEGSHPYLQILGATPKEHTYKQKNLGLVIHEYFLMPKKLAFVANKTKF